MPVKGELSNTEWVKQDWEKPDMVNHPAHYQSESGIEVIDIIDDFVADPGSYYKGNIIKYILRYEKKGGVEDLEKARWYLNRLIAYESVNAPTIEERRMSERAWLLDPTQEGILTVDGKRVAKVITSKRAFKEPGKPLIEIHLEDGAELTVLNEDEITE